MKKYLPALAVILAAILWSFDGILRQNLYTLPSFLIVALEHLIGAIIFLPLLLKGWKEVSDLHQRGWISVLWISVCGGILGTFFYTKALSYVNFIDLSVVVLLQKFQPIFAIALAAIILKEKITRRFLVLAVTAIVGGYFVTFGDQPLNEWSDKTIIAALLSLLAAFSWGSSTVLGKHALNRLSFKTVTSLRLTVTAAIMFFILISTGEAETISQVSIENYFLARMGYNYISAIAEWTVSDMNVLSLPFIVFVCIIFNTCVYYSIPRDTKKQDEWYIPKDLPEGYPYPLNIKNANEQCNITKKLFKSHDC